MRPLVRSYGDNSTFTRSPGRMRMKCFRILPETMPRISLSELSSFSLNIALGSAVVTVASTSIGSLLATRSYSYGSMDRRLDRHGTGIRGWEQAECAFQRNSGGRTFLSAVLVGA